VKILVLPRLRDGVRPEELERHAAAELQAVGDLYGQGIIREVYTRADRPGAVVFAVEAASVEAARQALAALPFVELNLIDLELIPLAPFTALFRLLRAA
jgi:muconolactone delta-isomerase